MPHNDDESRKTADRRKKELLEEAQKRFKHVQDAEEENRRAAESDLEFLVGDQWDEGAKRERERFGRPCLTINRLPQFVRQVVNDARQNRGGIKVHPVGEGSDSETAEVMQGMIRHIETRSCADIAYDTGVTSAVSSGWGYWRVVTDYVHDRSFDQEIKIERIRNPFAVYMDPASQDPTGADARFAFVTDRVPKSQFESMFPWAEQTDVELTGKADGSTTDASDWYDDETIRVAEYWKVEENQIRLHLMVDDRVLSDDERDTDDPADADAQIVESRTITTHAVKWYLISGSQVLDEREWPGKYIPIVRIVGDEIDVNGKLILRSLIRDAKDPQRMYNFWSSAETEHVQQAPVAPYIGTAAQFEGYEDYWEDAHRRPRPYLPYNADPEAGGMPQRSPAAQQQTGIMQAKLAVADDMKGVTGIYDAALGNRSNETSGVAIRQRQQEGDTSTFHFIDNLSRSIRQTGRILVDLIPHIYDTERYVRLLWEDNSDGEAKLQPGMGEYEREQLRKIRSTAQKWVADVTTGRYDVTVSTGPSYQTKRQEAADSMMQFIKAYPQAAQFAGDLIAKAMDWPHSDEIADRLKRALPPGITDDDEGQQQQPQPDPEMVKAQQQAQIDQYKAQTERVEADREHQRKMLEMQVDAELRLMEMNAKYSTEVTKAELDAYQRMVNQRDNLSAQAQQKDMELRQRDNAEAMRAAAQAQQQRTSGQAPGGGGGNRQ